MTIAPDGRLSLRLTTIGTRKVISGGWILQGEFDQDVFSTEAFPLEDNVWANRYLEQDFSNKNNHTVPNNKEVINDFLLFTHVFDIHSLFMVTFNHIQGFLCLVFLVTSFA